MEEQVFSIEGFKRLNGDRSISRLSISGFFRYKGYLESDVVTCTGIGSMRGVLKSREIFNDGRLKVKGSIHSDHVISSHYLVCHQIESKYIDINGQVVVRDQLRCEELMVDFTKRSKIKNIHANKVKVSNIHSHKRLDVRSIEAKDVHLDYVNAECVIGDHVTVGPNCRIYKIIYKGSITCDPRARVKCIKKE